MKRILVASDGSECAIAGAHYAIDLARLTGAGMIGLHVTDLDCLPGEISGAAVMETGSLADGEMREFARSGATGALDEIVAWGNHAE